jgi:subtilase family protein
MRIWTRNTAAFTPVALAIGVGLLSLVLLLRAASAAASVVAPLPPSDYGVRAVCATPAPGEAGCLALQLVPQTAEARAHTRPLGMRRHAAAPSSTPARAGEIGLRPQDLHSAYQLPASGPSPQTIALVDAYNDPTAEADLKAYDEEFGLPECTVAGGCLTQVNESGKASPLPFPRTNAELEAARSGAPVERKKAERATGWGGEISLDIETAHAICQTCKILLVEAESSAFTDLTIAEQSAENLGASEISNSWGGPENGQTVAGEAASAFDNPGIVITASAGDDGYLSWDAASSAERGFADFPAASPHVVAVGGTRLEIEAGGTWLSESVWNGDGAGGGGCSAIFEAPVWQENVVGFGKTGCHKKRVVSDVAADADPYTGIAVRDTSPNCSSEYEEGGTIHELPHWCTIGGTSLSSPLIASVFALAGGAKGAPYPARTLYQNVLAAPGAVHDVTAGSNGECTFGFQGKSGLASCTPTEESASCSAKRICLAAVGFDGPSGLGTPDGLGGFERSKADEEAPPEVPDPEEEVEEPAERGGAQPENPGGKEAQLPPGGGPSGEVGAGGATNTQPGGSGAPPAATLAKVPARVSFLSLTQSALIALNRTRPKLSAVSFAFTLTAPTRLRVTLARRVLRHRHAVWSAARGQLAFVAAAGRRTRHLSGSGLLAPGVYRLTLTPSGGTARSIRFQIG